ncbi:MAG TPA: type II CAAX endopeptidase family protein [Pseudonocardiaceae bacterium]|nr:type II CAAX endopeptidase family protein [Pseudonocardiaceae bacterium]
MLRAELLLVFGITLGLSGLRSLLRLVESLSEPEPLSEQAVALNAPAARADLIDLAFQLTGVLQLAAWGGLGVYLLLRGGTRLADVGLRRRPDGRDWLYGAGLAALIGIPGLGLYLVAHALGVNLAVLPSTLDDTWWRLPVLVLSAAANSWAEEVLVVGYLLTRLRQLGFGRPGALAISAVLRGSYHLYQGFGGFVGNVVMGLVFGWVWQRTNRLWPLVVGHALIDIVAFVGYAVLRGHVGWLP